MVRAKMAVRRKVRSRSRLSWAVLTVVPWCLAAGLSVSFVADAGQEPVIGATRFDLTDQAPGMPEDLVPSTVAARDRSFDLPLGDLDWMEQDLHRTAGETAEARRDPDEAEPRMALKPSHERFPTIEESRRDDPAVGVRPTFDTPLRRAGMLDAYRAVELSFGDAASGAAQDGFAPVPVDAPWPRADRLQPLSPGSNVTTMASHAAASPRAASGSTTPHVQDGSTPSVARAETLASTTPADSAPIEIAALPKFSRGPHGLITQNETVVGIAQYHPDYAAMIETAKSAPEQRCLAQAIYFEARSEPEEGQAAVAQVVLNRAMSGLYPGSVCGVVFQNQERRDACQFSFACDGHPLRMTEADAWANAVRIAHEVTDGSTYVSDIGGSTHYHANYVRPFWARSLKKMEVIGHHIFYSLKPGQT